MYGLDVPLQNQFMVLYLWARRQRVEWSVDWTCILEAPCSSDALTHYLELCLANLKFKSLSMPVNSQVVALLPVVILDLLKFHLDYLFQFVLSPIITHIAANKGKLLLLLYVYCHFSIKLSITMKDVY